MMHPRVLYSEANILRPLLKIAQCCALCVSEPKKKNCLKIYSIFVIVSLLTLCIWAIYAKCKILHRYSFFSVFLVDVLAIVFLAALVILSVVNGNFVKVKKFEKLLSDLVELDYLMATPKGGTFMKKRQKLILIELVIAHLLIFSFYFYDIYCVATTFGQDWVKGNVPSYVFDYFVVIEMLYISNFAVSIKYKLSNLNSALVNFVKEFLRNPPSPKKPILGEFLEAHNKLCNIIDIFSDCFGLQIFGILLTGVIYATHTIFLMLMYGSGKATPENKVSVIYVVFLYILVSVMYMIVGMLITIACTKASRCARYTATICYKLLLDVSAAASSVPENLLRKELLLFAEQIDQRKVHFNAGGFLTIDYNTLYNLFGSTAMNVIILLQFQKKGKES